MTDISADTINAAGFDFSQIDPNVYLVHDFITDEECSFLYDFAESRTEEDWIGTYVKGIEDRSESRYGTRDLEETKLEVTHNWNDKVLYVADIIGSYRFDERLKDLFRKDCDYSFRSFGVIQRQYAGAELGGHYDQYVDNRMRWAAVIYINDNYKDGELYFSEKEIAIVPPRKSLVVFPATEEYWHGVKTVGEGPTRYALPAFVFSEPDVF